jgi:ubiquinone/menaquinone biosynthesis C-methylase UbiE
MVFKVYKLILMTDKTIIKDHFSNTALVWRDRIYKSKKQQGIFEYFDKQYRFDYVVNMIPPSKEKNLRALDVGCGAGQLLPVLVKKGYQTHAIDVSRQMIDCAHLMCERENIKVDLQLGDCENLTYPDNYFDLYVAMGVIEYMDQDAPMLNEIKRVLRPGGIAIVTLRNVKSVHVRWRTFYVSVIETKLRNILRSILEKKTTPYQSISREHNPSSFRGQIASMSFRHLDERYAHFRTLPAPLDIWFKWLEAIPGKIMEKYCSDGKLMFMASTYIVKFQKLPE